MEAVASGQDDSERAFLHLVQPAGIEPATAATARATSWR
jgi:hypothetical protein